MNYYQGRSLSFLGLRPIDVTIECAQSRRLPFLQIIGASAAAANEQRERVIAAIEASGFRIPGRRLTLRYGPDQHGLPLEMLDAAAAVTILGSAKAFPTENLPPFAVWGGLGLDGSLRDASREVSLAGWSPREGPLCLYLPWETSRILGANGSGAGFSHLRSLIEHLRAGGGNGPRVSEPSAVSVQRGAKLPPGLGNAELRLAEISAAGGHHLLIVDGSEGQGTRIAETIRALLPRPLREDGLPPLRSLTEAQASRLFRFERRRGTWGELTLAHGGVLHLKDYKNEAAALGILWEAMRDGALRFTAGDRSLAAGADFCAVAEAEPCACGGGLSGCRCRPLAKEKRWRRYAAAPFDLRCYLPPSEIAAALSDHRSVAKARLRMLGRAGKLNGRLSLAEAMRALPWDPDASEWLKVGERKLGAALVLARTALTVSDLRAGESISREDLLEAWHHVAGLEFVGSNSPKRSGAVKNSTAIP